MPDFQRAQLLEATPIKLDAEDYHHPHPVRRNAQPLWIVGIDRADRRVMLQFDLRSPLCYWTTPEAAQAFLDRAQILQKQKIGERRQEPPSERSSRGAWK